MRVCGVFSFLFFSFLMFCFFPVSLRGTSHVCVGSFIVAGDAVFWGPAAGLGMDFYNYGINAAYIRTR